MTHRQLHVTYTDGRGTIESTVRSDDAEGLRQMDKDAFRFLARADVVDCHTETTDRTAGYKR